LGVLPFVLPPLHAPASAETTRDTIPTSVLVCTVLSRSEETAPVLLGLSTPL